MPQLYCPKCKNRLIKKKERYVCSDCSARYPILEGIPSFVDNINIEYGFKKEFFKYLYEIEKTQHYWHIGRKELIYDVLKRSYASNGKDIFRAKMMEVGCGNGSLLHYLEGKGINIEGGDIFFEGLKFCRKRTKAPLYRIDALNMPFKEKYDIIGAFDLIEHIEDDFLLLQEMWKVLKPKGKLIITVPASKLLWGYFDIVSMHKRRYSRIELVEKLERAGFVVEKVSFFIFFLFPAIFLFRSMRAIFKSANSHKINDSHICRFMELKNIPFLNGVFLYLSRLEKILMRYINLPFGSSLIALARKT